jgi:hypothetical protein
MRIYDVMDNDDWNGQPNIEEIANSTQLGNRDRIVISLGLTEAIPGNEVYGYARIIRNIRLCNGRNDACSVEDTNLDSGWDLLTDYTAQYNSAFEKPLNLATCSATKHPNELTTVNTIETVCKVPKKCDWYLDGRTDHPETTDAFYFDVAPLETLQNKKGFSQWWVIEVDYMVYRCNGYDTSRRRMLTSTLSLRGTRRLDDDTTNDIETKNSVQFVLRQTDVPDTPADTSPGTPMIAVDVNVPVSNDNNEDHTIILYILSGAAIVSVAVVAIWVKCTRVERKNLKMEHRYAPVSLVPLRMIHSAAKRNM